MRNFHQGSAPKDTRGQLGKQDEEARERPSLQGYSSSDNNQDEDFSERRSPFLHRSSENKIKQQQEQPQQINRAPFQQRYPLKDSDSNKISQISGRSQQENLVKFPQGYPAKGDSPLNNQSSYPDLQHQKSATKISTSAEHSSKDNLTRAQNTYHSQHEDFLAGETSLPKQLPKEDSSYNTQRLSPSAGRVHSHPKDNYHQPRNQDEDVSEGNSQEKTSVTSLQRYPPKKDSHLNHQSSKISNSPEESSKNTQTANHLPQKKLAGATSLQEERPKEQSSYNIRQPSVSDHSARKDNNPQPSHQSSGASKHQPTPISAPPIKNNYQNSHQPYQQQHLQSPISAPSPIKNNHQSSHQPYQQQQSDCSQRQPTKQVHPNTSYAQESVTNVNDHDPPKSKSSPIKDPPAALKSESDNSGTVPDPKNGSSIGGDAIHQVESSPKNVSKHVSVQRTESTSCCKCSIL